MEGSEEQGFGGVNRADGHHDFFPFDRSSGLIPALLSTCSV